MKQVIDIQKYKTDQQINQVANHNLRNVDSRNVNKSKTKSNRFFIGSPETDTVLELAKKLENVPKFRKDANRMVNLVLSASPEFFQTATKKQITDWENATQKWAEDTFGKDNIIYSVVHKDKKTPHFHIAIVPIFEGKLRSNHWFDGPMKLKKIHDSYAKVSKKFGIVRGQKLIKSKQEELETFYKKVNSSTAYDLALDKKLDDLFEQLEKPTLIQKLTPWSVIDSVVKPLMKQLKTNLSHYRTKTKNVENDLKELELSRQRVNDLELKMEKLGLDPNMSFMKCDEISDKVVSALAEKSPLSEDKAYQESSQPAYKAGVKVKLK